MLNFTGKTTPWLASQKLLSSTATRLGMVSPALKPIVLRMVYQVVKEVRIPIIGIGGVTKAEDVVEYMLAGASAVGIGYAGFRNPTALTAIIDDLEAWCDERGIDKVSNLIGAVLGGFLEYASMWIGLNNLYLLAATFYGVSLLLTRRLGRG